MKRDDGGAAFPQQLDVDHEFHGSDGMSLRDYFAAEALNSVYFDMSIGDDAKECANMARLAYQVADAMLAERAKR